MKRNPEQLRSGFTLVELLVVIGVIGVLVAILLPALSKAKQQSMITQCLSNLAQINAATKMYANDWNDRYPGSKITGAHPFRMAPGDRTPNDPSARPESWGLAAILHGISGTDDLRNRELPKAKYLDGRSKVWICPAAHERIRQYNNTYAFSIAARIDTPSIDTATGTVKEYPWSTTKRRAQQKNQPWVYDNYNSRPGISFMFGPPPSGGEPFLLWYPHVRSGKKRVLNQAWLDGRVDSRFLD